MVLGVYWYFGFPEELYSYEYFTFQKGLGGHADAPAELLAEVNVTDADGLILELKSLTAQYSDALVFVYRFANTLQIGIGGYNMHDYEFELAKKIDAILKEKNAQKIKITTLSSFELIRLGNQQVDVSGFSKKYFSIVGSELRKNNAETTSIRFDCNVDATVKDAFLNELTNAISGIHVVYYLEKHFGDRFNLMLFFTNGRQGIGLTAKQNVDVAVFEKQMDELIRAYNIQIGHISGFENYPTGKQIVLKIVDEEFVLK